MKNGNNLVKIFLLSTVFALQLNAKTPSKSDAKTGATKKVDTVSTPTVSQVDKWKTLINLDDYVFKNKRAEKINYTPNYYKYIDKSSKEIVINGRVYDYDASSGASRTAADMVNHSQTLKYDGKKGAAKELEADNLHGKFKPSFMV